jgi:heterodisulfide reductase subunit D
MPLHIYWGCTIDARLPQIKGSMRDVLRAAQLDFVEWSGNSCCGLPFLLAGDLKGALGQASATIDRLKDVGTVITPCAGCYATFTKRYPSTLQLQMPFKVMHSTQLIDRLLADGKLKLKGGHSRVVYHDPCELGRERGTHAEPRRILRSMPEVEVVGAELAGERSNCCGGGGLLPSCFPDLAIEIASRRIARDLIPLRPEILVTSCPSCYLNFSRALERGEYGLRLVDITELVAERISGEE